LNVHGSALARRAQAGETITITDRGRPIADLVPHTSAIRFAIRDHLLADLAGIGG
jgi:antitoxin (DNA-binding transcriptional repressor) of toxin-antitoxin stability system